MGAEEGSLTPIKENIVNSLAIHIQTHTYINICIQIQLRKNKEHIFIPSYSISDKTCWEK